MKHKDVRHNYKITIYYKIKINSPVYYKHTYYFENRKFVEIESIESTLIKSHEFIGYYVIQSDIDYNDIKSDNIRRYKFDD